MVNKKTASHTGRKTYKSLSVLMVVIVLVGAAIIAYKLIKKPDVNISSKPTTVTGTLSTPTVHNPTATSSPPPGGVVNNNPNTTQTSSLPPASQWSSSANGDITLQQPVNGGTIATGAIISGLSKVSTLQFILVDNTVGLIDQGNLTVTNGKFSGTMEFTSHSSAGKLSIYYPNPTNGKEEDIISINVNFSN